MSRLLCIFLLCCLAAFATWWMLSDSTAPLSSPQGKRPAHQSGASTFLGASACADCHSEIASLYAGSAHNNTFQLTTDSDFAKSLNGRRFHDAQRDVDFHYHFDSQGLSVTLPGVFGSDRFPLPYALGSGTHAVTFLSLIPHDSGGTLGLEHRVSYYHDSDNLGITVGQNDLPMPSQDVEHFGKFVTGKDLIGCIDCHTTAGHIRGLEVSGLIPHVGCESCHGAGSQHVTAMNAGAPLTAFDTKRKWPTAESELRTCGVCHRLPESLIETELKRESRSLVRFQPVGLMQSLCYKNSDGAMRCTSCHDPHAKVSRDTAAYVRICLDCHSAPSVECPTGKTQCIDCHMPSVSLGVASFHDHWIRVRDESDPPSKTVDPAVFQDSNGATSEAKK